MGTHRGRQRFIKTNSSQIKSEGINDPVSAYRTMIENIDDYIGDVKNKPSNKNEQFIKFDSSKLKMNLTEAGNEFIQYILNSLVQESKDDLHSLCTEMQETVEELRQHCTKLEQLKRNRERYAEVRSKEHLLEARIQPIRMKFAYIMDDDK